jgi:hypothetical protein
MCTHLFVCNEIIKIPKITNKCSKINLAWVV